MVVVEKQVTLGGGEITSAGIPMSERGSRAGKIHVISAFGASRKLNLMDPQLGLRCLWHQSSMVRRPQSLDLSPTCHVSGRLESPFMTLML